MSGRPRLHLSIDGQRLVLPPGAAARVGRDPGAEVSLTDTRVSREHAHLVPTATGWDLVDASKRGTFLDGRRVQRVPITGPLVVRLGDPDGPALELRPLPGLPDGSTPSTAAPSAVATIGRAPDNTVVVDDLRASRYHAEIRGTGEQAQLVDLDSHNGTFLNGHRTSGTVPVRPGDEVGVATAQLLWDGHRLTPTPVVAAETLCARHLRVQAGQATLLDDVSFALPPRCLLAVLGPSGAGKSTLLGALTGLSPAAAGTVTWQGRDLYREYDQLRATIGLVPQEDILHRQLVLGRALQFAARLRFPRDTTTAERDRRVSEVLAAVGLSDRAELRIDRLSGGQRKRTSIALELLTAPDLLFLDEPTSGLDPGLDRQVMGTLRDLADGDRTVVVVTHSVLNLEGCDRLLLLARGGRTAFFGTPAELLSFFGAADHSAVFLAVEQDPEGWVARYAASELAARYAVPDTPGGPAPTPPPPPPAPAPAPATVGRQWHTLVRRQLAVLAADREFVALLFGLPLLLGLLEHLVPGDVGLNVPSTEWKQRLTIYLMGGCLIGAAMSVRELVTERPIYTRERAVGLSPNAYLGSKLAVLGAVVAAQAAMFTLIGQIGVPGPAAATALGSGRVELMVDVAAAAASMLVVGLLVSAVVSTAEQAMPLLVAVVMAELMLSGALVQIDGRTPLEQVAWAAGARWAYAATASTATPPGTAGATNPVIADHLVEHAAGHWVRLLLVLLGLSLVLVVLLRLALDRSVRRRRVA